MPHRHTRSGLSHDVVEGGSEACRPTSEHKWEDSLRPLLLFFFHFHLSSPPTPLLLCHSHGFQQDVRAGESGELRGVSGSDRYTGLLADLMLFKS